MQFTSLTSISPSFTAHSDIAARVVEELGNKNAHNDDINQEDDIYNFDDDMNHFYLPEDDEPEDNCMEVLKENEEESSEFEFAVSADAIFFNSEILPRYPLFDRSLLLNNVSNRSNNPKPDRRSLRKLFIEEELGSVSDRELEGVTPGTYCIWKPKKSDSDSTANSSKRWKLALRNLLHRNHSDIIVFRPLTLTKKVEKTAKVAGADDDGEAVTVAGESKSANINLRNKNEGDRVRVRVRSYLPYKRDLVGVGVFAC